MNSEPSGGAVTAVVVMGVSGTGKTTVAQVLARRLGWRFIEADDLHPLANVEKMAHGIPLDDADRLPWLRLVVAGMDECAASGEDVVVTCSALKRSYRDLLRGGRAVVRFVHLTGDPELVAERLARRPGHFMPPSLLASQLATLEPLGADEDGVEVSIAGDPEGIAGQAIELLGL